jgi:hypothetical protein
MSLLPSVANSCNQRKKKDGSTDYAGDLNCRVHHLSPSFTVTLTYADFLEVLVNAAYTSGFSFFIRVESREVEVASATYVISRM